jgi:hypothetical protein
MSNFSIQEIYQEIDRQAPESGIDPKLVRAFFAAENSATGEVKRTHVSGATTSPAGARGVMQTMPRTEELLKQNGWLPQTWNFNPGDLKGQVQAGIAAIREMQSRQKDKSDPLELAAMYNGGTQAWRNYRAGLLDQLPAETRGYFEKIKTALGGASMTPAASGSFNQSGVTPQQMERQSGQPQAPSQQQQPGSGGTSSSSRTSVTTRSNSFDTERLAAALSTGIQLIENGGTADTALAGIEAGIAQRQAAEVAQQAAIQQVAQSAGAATTAETAVATAAAVRRKQILEAASLNPDVANNIAAQAMSAVIGEQAALEALGSDIDSRMAVGFFDNPLMWFVNQTRLPGMVGQYNQGVNQVNRKIDAAKNLQELANTQISLSQAIDADQIAAAGAARAAQIAAEAQKNLADVQAAQAGNAIRDANTALAIQGTKFQTAVTLAELTRQQITSGAAKSERDAENRAQEIALGRVNRYLKMIGSNQQYDTASFRSIPAKAREELFALSSTDRIASNLPEALAIIDRYGNMQKIAAEGDAAAVTWIRNTAGRAQQMATEDLKVAEAQAKVTGKMPKREDAYNANLLKVQQLYQAEAADMRTASPDNPIKISYDAALKDPGLAGNGVVAVLQQIGPTSPTPLMTKVDEKLILEKFATDIATGKTTSAAAAAEIANFYKTSREQQIRRTKYPLFGIEVPTNGYTVVIPKPGIFESNVGSAGGTVDLTNPAAVESFLIKDVAVRARNSQPLGSYRPFMDPLGLSKPGAAQ